MNPVIEGNQDKEELSDADRHLARRIFTTKLFYDVEAPSGYHGLHDAGHSMKFASKLAYGAVEVPFEVFFRTVQRLAVHSGFQEPSKLKSFANSSPRPSYSGNLKYRRT